MEARQWARQWKRLVRQEAELGAVTDPLLREPRDSARGPGPAASLQQLRTQLNRQLEVLRVQVAGQKGEALAPGLERRQRHCAAVLAQLATTCAAQLQELEPMEAEAGAEYEAASASVQQLLTAPSASVQLGVLGAAGSTPRPTAAAPNSSLPPEVAAHDTFLQRLGPTGGWHPDDHVEFERILRACRGNYAHCAQLCGEQLGLLHSADDVERHARWHEELQRMQLAKRLAVQRWRLARQAEQAALLEQTSRDAAVCEQGGDAQGGTAARTRQQEQKQQQRSAVVEWKAAREEARLAALRRQQAEEEERRLRDVAARQRHQQENRQALEQQRQDKQAAAQKQRLTEESSSGGATHRSCSSNADAVAARQRLQDRNQELLERRAAAVRRHSQQASEQAQRVEQLARRASQQFGFGASAERDPQRLLQATSATALRQLAALSEERTARDSGFIRHLPRRATPGWCAEAQLQ